MMSEQMRTAPPGQYRVIGVDTFDGAGWVHGDYTRLDDARAIIEYQTRGKQMLKYYVYNDKGDFMAEAGTF